MESPQLENGYTKIANELLAVIAQTKLNGTQFRILMVVWRYTYGFNRKEHALSETFISNATGINKRQVQRELNQLIQMNIIEVVSKATFNCSRTLTFNKYHNSWQVTKKTPPDEKDTHTGDELVTSPDDELVTQEIKIKENIKESTITFIGNLEGDVVDNLEVDADSTQGLDRIERHYAANVLQRASIGSKDLQIILEAYKKYPVDFIIECMDRAVEKYKFNNNGVVNIKSFKYFEAILKDEWDKKLLREAGEKVQPEPPTMPTRQDSGYRRPAPAKSNRFNNFEQRTAKYTKEELEKLLNKKQSQEG